MKITLPWPPKELSPNARVHWAVKAKAAKTYRQLCAILTRQSGAKAKGIPLNITVSFHPPDNRPRDDDNYISAFKPGRDGVADALGIDDKHFHPTYQPRQAPIKGGAVIIEME